MNTRQQQWAQRAAAAVQRVQAAHKRGAMSEAEYQRFTKGFPALIHTSGLCQALAFAEVKGRHVCVEDLAETLGLTAAGLLEQSRTGDVTSYLKLSRGALAAATWLKRYAEALLKGDEQEKARQGNDE